MAGDGCHPRAAHCCLEALEAPSLRRWMRCPTARLPARPIFGALLLLTLAATAEAASPRLTAVRPLGGRRGTEVEVHFTGQRLGDAQEILFYQPGISASKVEKVDDNHAKALVKMAMGCASYLVYAQKDDQARAKVNRFT